MIDFEKLIINDDTVINHSSDTTLPLYKIQQELLQL